MWGRVYIFLNRFYWFFLIALGLTTAFAAYQMTQIYFWAYKPLWLFLLSFLFLVFILKKILWRDPVFTRRLVLALLSGCLLALAFPPIGLTMTLFVAWIPLWLLEKELQATEIRGKTGLFAIYAYLAVLLWNIIVTWWVSNAGFVPGIAAMTINSLFMIVPIMAFHFLPYTWGLWRYLAFAAFWFSFEYLHLSWEISWPWLTLGNAFSATPMWVQWYEFTGVFGGGLWVFIGNIALFHLYSSKSVYSRKGQLILVCLVMPLLFSCIMYFNENTEHGTPVNVAIVQPSYEPFTKKFTIPQGEQVEHFLELSRKCVTHETDYLVFPETSVSRVYTPGYMKNTSLQAFKNFIDSFPDLALVTGLERIHVYDGPVTGKYIRTSQRGERLMYYDVRNSVECFISGSSEIQSYTKSKLVPGPEIFPYGRYLFFFKPIIDKMGGTIQGLATQAERDVFTHQNQRIAPAICYESIYGDYMRGYFRKAANGIFIVTNDSWWDNTWGYKQHLKLGVLRAIEFRKEIARSANSGVSCFVNTRGDIRRATKYDNACCISGTMYLNDRITLYQRIGDIIAYFSICASFIIGIYFLYRNIRRRI